jgi:hypothetical protein
MKIDWIFTRTSRVAQAIKIVLSLVRKRANEPPKTEIENAADANNLLDASCAAQNQIYGQMVKRYE